MSQVSTWALAVDGKYYQDPIFWGTDWFLCFDDDEPPELVIKQKVEDFRDHKALLKRADEILTGLGLRYTTIAKPMYSYRCFFNEKGMPFAGAIFLHITAPIPVPIHYSNVGSYDEASAHDCVLYTFGVKP